MSRSYRRDGESVGQWLNFFRAGLLGLAYRTALGCVGKIGENPTMTQYSVFFLVFMGVQGYLNLLHSFFGSSFPSPLIRR
jgi:hypothetical protein